MGGDKRFPWLILLRRQFLIKLIMSLKGGSKGVGGRGDGGQCHGGVGPEEGRRLGGGGVVMGVVVVLWQHSLQVPKMQALDGQASEGTGLVPVCLCSPGMEVSGKNFLGANSLLGCWEHPPCPVSCLSPQVPSREAGPSTLSSTKSPSYPFSYGSKRITPSLH